MCRLGFPGVVDRPGALMRDTHAGSLTHTRHTANRGVRDKQANSGRVLRPEGSRVTPKQGLLGPCVAQVPPQASANKTPPFCAAKTQWETLMNGIHP